MRARQSVFKHPEQEALYVQRYDESLLLFEMSGEDLTIATSYGDTHVIRYGDRKLPPLLLLHGMTMSSTMWYPNVKAWSEVRCVYVVDVIGDFGKSRLTQTMRSREQARRWLDDVRNGLGLQQMDIGGHSMGGFLAIDYAQQYPAHVSRLLLYAPVATFCQVRPSFFLYVYPALLWRTERWVDRAFHWMSGTKQPLHRVFREQVLQAYRDATPRLQVMPVRLSRDELERITMPTLLLIGDREVIYPASRAMAYAQCWLPDVEVHLIAGASHALTIEHAEQVNGWTLQFLSSAEKPNL